MGQEGTPGMFILAITQLEQYIEKEHARQQEGKAKGERVSENRQRLFNTLRAKVKKGNRTYEEDVKRCRDNPEEFQSDNEDEDKDSSASEDGSGGDSSDSDSDSDDSSSSDSSSDSDSDSEGESWSSGSEDSEMGGDEEAVREKKMLRWLITDEKKEKEAKRAQKEKELSNIKKKKEGD